VRQEPSGSINNIVRNGGRVYQISCTAIHGAVLTFSDDYTRLAIQERGAAADLQK